MLTSLPKIEVRYENLKYSVKIPRQSASHELPNVFRTIFNTLTFPARLVHNIATRATKESRTEDFTVLEGISGVIKPGTLTL